MPAAFADLGDDDAVQRRCEVGASVPRCASAISANAALNAFISWVMSFCSAHRPAPRTRIGIQRAIGIHTPAAPPVAAR